MLWLEIPCYQIGATVMRGSESWIISGFRVTFPASSYISHTKVLPGPLSTPSFPELPQARLNEKLTPGFKRMGETLVSPSERGRGIPRCGQITDVLKC